MQFILQASRDGKSRSERVQYAKAGTPASQEGVRDLSVNPQTYARSKMDDSLAYDVYRKCVHGVKKCRHCHVIPLLTKSRKVVSYFVEHHRSNGQLITCTVGIGGIRPYKVHQMMSEQEEAAEILQKLRQANPEMANSDDGEPTIDLDDQSPVNEITIDPDLQRMMLDDSVISEPTNTEHLESSLGSQMEQVQKSLKTSFSTPVVRRASRCLEQLVLLFVGLQYDTSLEAIVTRCVQFLSAITEGGIVLTLKDTLMKYVANAKMPSMLEGKTVKEAFGIEQSSAAEPEMFSKESLKIWETLKQGIFTKHLSYILGTVFAFSACKIKNVKFSHPIYEKVIEHANNEEIDGMDLIDHAIKLYNWTSTVGMACLESRSLEPLTINSSTLAKCHEKFYHWQKKFLDFKRTGRSTSEERQQMFVEVESIQKILERFTKVQKEKFMTLQASSLHREVLSLYNDVRDFVQKIDRVKVAKGYHLTGLPKAGKSTLVPMLQEQIATARGVEYREQDNAQINLMAPYQDELNNATQTITINETVPIKEHLAKSVENAYNTALALIDPVPYHPNRSNLEDKAKITMTHIGVVSTGNTEQPFINVAKTPGAWERRYTIISMTVLDKYADDFGRLDSSKTDGTNDYHSFDVYEIVYLGKERKVVYFTYEGKKSVGLDTRELFELIRKQCIDHFAEQDRLDEQHNAEKQPACLTCKRLGFLCVCPNKSAHTMKHVRINTCAASVHTNLSDSEICPERTVVGGKHGACKFHSGGLCAYCGREEPPSDSEEEAEMGIVATVASTAGSLMWETVLPWVNPFVKLKWLWSIDNNAMRVFHEELVEELSYWPEHVACSTFSLIPESWEKRADGSSTWFGRKKDTFLRMVAAEKQIFLPLSYLFRRALCLGLITFILLTAFGATMEYFGLNPREYDQVVLMEREYTEFGWYYFFPQFSQFVMARREMYAEMGIFTERYLDWRAYYVNIYFFEKILGYLCIPWWFTFTRTVPVIVTKMYQWWLMPCIVSVCVTTFIFFYTWWRRAIGFNKRYEDLKARCKSDPQFQTELYDKARRHHSEYNSLVPTAVGVIGAIVTGLVIWNSMRTPESGFKAEPDDAPRKTWNDWFSFNREVAAPHQTVNATSSENVKRLGKGLTALEAEVDGKDRTVFGVYLEPGILTFPRHFLKVDAKKEELLEYIDMKMETNGVKHKVRAYAENCVRIGSKDAVVMKVPRAPKMSITLKHMLPKSSGTDYIKSVLLFLKPKKLTQEEKDKPNVPSFTLEEEKFNAKYEDAVYCGGFNCGRGISYVSKNTKKGFCGAPIVADRKDGAILGFHISGMPYNMVSRSGYAQEITYSDYCAAVEKLKSQPHFTTTPEMAVLNTTRLGKDLVPGKGPHPKTEMFKEGAMDDYPCIEVVGHDPVLPRYRSRVRRSLLCEALEKHCDWKPIWKAPDMKEPWKHHNKNLKRIAKGAWEVPPASLRWARDDYWNQILKPLKEHIKNHPEMCKPLTLDEAINGVPDAWYMKRYRMDTSDGILPGNRLSSGTFVEIDPYEDGRKRYALSPEAAKYFEGMLESFDKRQSIGVYIRTCLKDEVVEEESEKVRIFYILECLFGLATRMYYLPIAEFISRHPKETECMVGVNCAGPEWEGLVSYINELATDGRLNDWDFSGYDICRAPDVMCTSLNIQKDVGGEMCYTTKELNRMEMIGEELRNPMVNWNGTVMFLFIWCSGNTMTVYGNSIENSLHQRISFHWNGVRLRGDKFYELGRYCDNEHIATYGDDGHGGSKPEVRDITRFSSRKMYFDFIGMGFTDARKNASEGSDETVESHLVDFLKRKSVYHELLGLRVGALDEKSIRKMGMMSAGRGEPEDLAISAVQTMLHEAFLHGETYYEWLRGKLKLVCKDCGIWAKELDVSYFEKAQLWKEKYAS